MMGKLCGFIGRYFYLAAVNDHKTKSWTVDFTLTEM